MDRVGAFGHSFGGAVAAEDCLEDSRFKSALNMDGSFWGPVQKTGLAKPVMTIEEEDGQFTPEQLLDRSNQTSQLLYLSDMAMMRNSNGYRIIVRGSTHSSYSDRSLFSPFKRYSGEGPTPAIREYTILRQYVLAFFDKTLRGEDPTLLNGKDHPYPEVILQVLHRP